MQRHGLKRICELRLFRDGDHWGPELHVRTMGQAQRLADDLKKASRLSGVLQFGVGVPLVLKPVDYGRTIQLPLFWVVKVG